MRFGWFELGEEVIRTAEGSVLQCRHLPTHRTYLTRAPRGGDVRRNAAVELADVRATAAAASKLYSGRHLGAATTVPAGHVLQEYYGVLDERYLLPASAVYRSRGALSFDSLLEVSTILVRISPFWENLWLLLISETSLLASGSMSLEAWDERWRDLVCGSDLGRRLVDELPGDLGERSAAHLLECVENARLGPGPTLEESAVVRLLIGVVSDMLTEEQIRASLACPFFRLDVTVHDLHYAVALLRLVQPQPWMLQSPLEWLGPTVLALPVVLDGLSAQPSAFPVDADAFEPAPAPDERALARFSSFVREPERTVRSYIALESA